MVYFAYKVIAPAVNIEVLNKAPSVPIEPTTSGILYTIMEVKVKSKSDLTEDIEHKYFRGKAVKSMT